jgi:hypothetical protein
MIYLSFCCVSALITSSVHMATIFCISAALTPREGEVLPLPPDAVCGGVSSTRARITSSRISMGIVVCF